MSEEEADEEEDEVGKESQKKQLIHNHNSPASHDRTYKLC